MDVYMDSINNEWEAMDLKNVLFSAKNGEISREEALYLFKKVSGYREALELFKVSSIVRNDEVGPVYKLDGFIGPITRCTTSPPCSYCGAASTFRKPLRPEEVAMGARLIEETGTKRVELGGGTFWEGADEIVLEAVKSVDSSTSLEMWINVGPSLSREVLNKMKGMGVKEVCSSLEAWNPDVFKEAKPGDSLEERKKFARMVKAVGLDLISVMMVGIGSTYEDYVEHIFWLKDLGVDAFYVTGFKPVPGTPFEDRKPALSLEVAKTAAIARLVLRDRDTSMGGIMNDLQLLPLQIMAGVNRHVHLGAHVHRPRPSPGPQPSTPRNRMTDVRCIDGLEFVNMLPLTTTLIERAGMEVEDCIAERV